MFARRVAAFCLFNLAVSAVWGAGNQAPAERLVVYLSADAIQSPRVIDSLKRELSRLMRTAGYELDLHDSATESGGTASALLLVSLQGACSMPAGDPIPPPLENPVSLGATAIAEGHVLPFSFVNCGRLTRMLAPLLIAEPPMRRDLLYGRAAARVLAHEFYHVLLGERDHAADGLAKAIFSPTELIGEQFEFESSTRAKLMARKSRRRI